MTIQSVVLCDECEAVFAPEGHKRRGTLSRLAHQSGWTSTNTDGQWKNLCPDHNTTKE